MAVVRAKARRLKKVDLRDLEPGTLVGRTSKVILSAYLPVKAEGALLRVLREVMDNWQVYRDAGGPVQFTEQEAWNKIREALKE